MRSAALPTRHGGDSPYVEDGKCSAAAELHQLDSSNDGVPEIASALNVRGGDRASAHPVKRLITEAGRARV